MEKLWRVIGSVAYRTFHTTQTLAHKSYVKGGRHGRRRQERKPLTAIWKWWQNVKAQF
jgi:hypothetical protein